MLQLDEEFDIELFAGNEFYRHPAILKLPKTICLPVNMALEVINLCNSTYLRMEDQGTPEFLLNELIILLCRKNIDFEDNEYQATLRRFAARGVSGNSYDNYKARLLTALNGFYNRLYAWLEAWREYSDVELSGCVRYDLNMVVFKFNVNPSGVEVDQVINDWVNSQIEAGRFVPYRYMRLLGRM
jgi:hypothetical protein